MHLELRSPPGPKHVHPASAGSPVSLTQPLDVGSQSVNLLDFAAILDRVQEGEECIGSRSGSSDRHGSPKYFNALRTVDMPIVTLTNKRPESKSGGLRRTENGRIKNGKKMAWLDQRIYGNMDQQQTVGGGCRLTE